MLDIYDRDNNNQEIKLDCDIRNSYHYCIFNLKGEFILYRFQYKLIFIYSTQSKNNKWKCKKMYEIPYEFELISISKYDKLYLLSNNSAIYEYSLITEKSIKIFGIDEEIKNRVDLRDYITKNIRIFSDEKFICARIKDKIIIYRYSIELEIPIVSLNINDGNYIKLKIM